MTPPQARRRWRRLLGVLGLGCALACPASAADPVDLLGTQSPERLPLASGARVLVWTLDDRGGGRPLELVVVVVPGGGARWRVVETGIVAPRADTLAAAACEDAVAVASGGFFVAMEGGGYAPLGLAVGDGTELSPFSPRRYGGVLVREGEQSAILPIAAFDPATQWQQALQSSPVVVAEGANDMLRDDRQADNRLAVGLNGTGDMVIVGAFRSGGGAVSLHTLAELIVALGEAADVAVDDALALDGGSSAHLLLPESGRHWGSSLAGYMPNALCLEAP